MECPSNNPFFHYVERKSHLFYSNAIGDQILIFLDEKNSKKLIYLGEYEVIVFEDKKVIKAWKRETKRPTTNNVSSLIFENEKIIGNAIPTIEKYFGENWRYSNDFFEQGLEPPLSLLSESKIIEIVSSAYLPKL